MCFTLPWHPPKWVTTGLTILFLFKWIALLHKDETPLPWGPHTDLRGSKQNQVVSNRPLCKERYKAAPNLWEMSVTYFDLHNRAWKKGVSHEWEQQMGFSEQHLSKGIYFTRCNFSPAGLTNSSEGSETCTAACLLSLISPNTQGSFRGCKDLNTCSGKESLGKFAETNLPFFFFFKVD